MLSQVVVLDLSILARSAVTLQVFLFSPSNSLSNQLLSYFMWMRMMEVSPSLWLKKSALYCKITHKMHGRQNVVTKTEQPRATTVVYATAGCSCWWLSRVDLLFCFFSLPVSCCNALTLGICYDMLVLGHFGPLQVSYLILQASKHLIIS